MFNQGRRDKKAPRPVKIGEFILGETIGTGAFASVRLARHAETGQQYAVKVIDRRKLDSAVYERQVRRESKILQILEHPNIVRIKRILKSRTCAYMIMEYVRGGELFQEITDNIHLEEETARRYFRQLTSALAYAHGLDVMHRDIKPENILLDESKENIKIADFGMGWCREADMRRSPNRSDELMRTRCGTPKYMPPELLDKTRREAGYSAAKLDVWSCGMVLYACLAGYLPFAGDTGDAGAVLEQIGEWEDLAFPAWFSGGARDVLRLALARDPARRADMAALRDHAWTRAAAGPGRAPRASGGRPGVPAIRLDGAFGVRALEFEFASPVTPDEEDATWAR